MPRPALFPSPAADRQAIDPARPGRPGHPTVHSHRGGQSTHPTHFACCVETSNQPQAQQGLLACISPEEQKGGTKKSTVRSATLSRPRFQLPLQRPVPRPTSNYWPSVAFLAVAATARLGPFPVAWQVCAMGLGEGEVVCTWSHATGGQPFQAGEQLKGPREQPSAETGEICHSLTKSAISGRERAVGQQSSCGQIGELVVRPCGSAGDQLPPCSDMLSSLYEDTGTCPQVCPLSLPPVAADPGGSTRRMASVAGMRCAVLQRPASCPRKMLESPPPRCRTCCTLNVHA